MSDIKWISFNDSCPPDDGLYLLAEPYLSWGGCEDYEVGLFNCKSSIMQFSNVKECRLYREAVNGSFWAVVDKPDCCVFPS